MYLQAEDDVHVEHFIVALLLELFVSHHLLVQVLIVGLHELDCLLLVLLCILGVLLLLLALILNDFTTCNCY